MPVAYKTGAPPASSAGRHMAPGQLDRFKRDLPPMASSRIIHKSISLHIQPGDSETPESEAQCRPAAPSRRMAVVQRGKDGKWVRILCMMGPTRHPATKSRFHLPLPAS